MASTGTFALPDSGSGISTPDGYVMCGRQESRPTPAAGPDRRPRIPWPRSPGRASLCRIPAVVLEGGSTSMTKSGAPCRLSSGSIPATRAALMRATPATRSSCSGRARNATSYSTKAPAGDMPFNRSRNRARQPPLVQSLSIQVMNQASVRAGPLATSPLSESGGGIVI